MAEQWLEASSALRIAGNHLSLCSRLHAGLVVARAAKLKMDDQEQLQALVGKAFWWAEGHEALEQDWVSGLFLAFSSDTPPRFIDAFPCSLAPASRTGAATMERLAYSINDTARTLSLGRTSIYAMIADGRLEAFKLGRRTLIRADSIRRLVAAQV